MFRVFPGALRRVLLLKIVALQICMNTIGSCTAAFVCMLEVHLQFAGVVLLHFLCAILERCYRVGHTRLARIVSVQGSCLGHFRWGPDKVKPYAKQSITFARA